MSGARSAHLSRHRRRYGLIAVLCVALVLSLPLHNIPTAPSNAPPTLGECLRTWHHPCLSPAATRAFYGVDALAQRGITGKGRTIAIVVSFGSPTIRSDLHAFDIAFGLPDPDLRIVAPMGTGQPVSSGWDGETALDVEWAHAIAPDARLVLLISPVDETEGVQGLPQFLTLERLVLHQHLADVISQSWGATEETLFDKAGRSIVAQFHSFYAQAAAAGITAIAASGDEGAAGYDLSSTRLLPYRVVGYPASDPLVLSVGGTRLSADSNGQLSGEVAWSGSGGGASKLFSEPSYQQGLPTTQQHLLSGRRGLPDVAYNSDPASPFLIYLHGHWTTTAGTSAATPQWAGLIALADSLAGHDLGSVNAALYHLAASPSYARDLHDVTEGSIIGPNGEMAYQAGPGWDAATGLGTPRAAALIPDLVTATRP